MRPGRHASSHLECVNEFLHFSGVFLCDRIEAMSESNAVTVSIMRPAHSSMSTKSTMQAAEMILLSDTEAMPLLHQ